MPEIPFALGCPSCSHYVEVSTEDPDASLSELYGHIFRSHASYSQAKTYDLLAKAAGLTKAEAADWAGAS